MSYQHHELMAEHNVEVTTLPEPIQNNIALFNAELDKYDLEAEDEKTLARKRKLSAIDMQIAKDIQRHFNSLELEEEEEKEPDPTVKRKGFLLFGKK